MTANTVQKVYQLIIQDLFYESILEKYFYNEEDRNEFRQEMWVHIGNIKESKVIKSWNEGWFKYLFVGIVKKQIISNSSRWHKMFRQPSQNREIDNNYDSMQELEQSELEAFEEDWSDKQIEAKIKLKMLEPAIKEVLRLRPELIKELDLFEKKYIKKMKYRQIAKLLNIPLSNVHAYVQTARVVLKNYINRKYEE